MQKLNFAGIMLVGVLLLSGRSMYAQTVGQDMKDAGHDTAHASESVAHHTANGTKKVFHKTAHGTSVAAHDTAHETSVATHKTADVSKEGYNKTANGTRTVGRKIEGKPAEPSTSKP